MVSTMVQWIGLILLPEFCSSSYLKRRCTTNSAILSTTMLFNSFWSVGGLLRMSQLWPQMCLYSIGDVIVPAVLGVLCKLLCIDFMCFFFDVG